MFINTALGSALCITRPVLNDSRTELEGDRVPHGGNKEGLLSPEASLSGWLLFLPYCHSGGGRWRLCFRSGLRRLLSWLLILGMFRRLGDAWAFLAGIISAPHHLSFFTSLLHWGDGCTKEALMDDSSVKEFFLRFGWHETHGSPCSLNGYLVGTENVVC